MEMSRCSRCPSAVRSWCYL